MLLPGVPGTSVHLTRCVRFWLGSFFLLKKLSWYHTPRLQKPDASHRPGRHRKLKDVQNELQSGSGRCAYLLWLLQQPISRNRAEQADRESSIRQSKTVQESGKPHVHCQRQDTDLQGMRAEYSTLWKKVMDNLRSTRVWLKWIPLSISQTHIKHLLGGLYYRQGRHEKAKHSKHVHPADPPTPPLTWPNLRYGGRPHFKGQLWRILHTSWPVTTLTQECRQKSKEVWWHRGIRVGDNCFWWLLRGCCTDSWPEKKASYDGWSVVHREKLLPLLSSPASPATT